MTAYYNEIEPFAAEWLRNLISAGHIAPGEVDTRSIKDVTPDDVRGFTQCHFFAGVGGWSLALRLAGWPDSRPVWTGSCPCQPFSDAGLGRGEEDERHLWPEFRRLITECHPAIAFGEQVASKAGRNWLARVRADLEALGYGVGAADLCAAGAGEEGEGWFVYPSGVVIRERTMVGAPHIRQRLYWVAYAGGSECRWWRNDKSGTRILSDAPDRSSTSRLGLSASERDRTATDAGSDCTGEGEGRQRGAGGSSASGELGDSAVFGQEGRDAEHNGTCGMSVPSGPQGWSDFAIIPCADGKSRRVESGSFPLAHGVPRDMGRGRSKVERVAIGAARTNRTGRLKGYGNAIVPQLAAEFIAAFLEC